MANAASSSPRIRRCLLVVEVEDTKSAATPWQGDECREPGTAAAPRGAVPRKRPPASLAGVDRSFCPSQPQGGNPASGRIRPVVRLDSMRRSRSRATSTTPPKWASLRLSPAPLSFGLSLIAALLVRLWVASLNAGITMDSPLYVNMSEALVRLEPAPGPAHHGYPAFIALVHLVVPGREWPGRIASLIASLALLPIVWILARRTLTPLWSTLPMWVLALHPLLVVFGVAIMTEATFMAISYGALALIDRRPWAAGAAFGLAYVVRPEALVIAPAATLLSPRGRRGALWVLLGFALVVVPYLGYMRWERGTWSLTPKAALVGRRKDRWRDYEWRVRRDTTATEEPKTLIARIRWAAPSMATHYLPNLRQHLVKLLWAWPLPLLLLSLLGLATQPWLLLAPLATLPVLPLLNVPYDLRFPQLFVPSLAILAARGAAWVAERAGPRYARASAATIAAAALGLVWAWAGRPGTSVRTFDEGPMPQMREAGAWLHEHARPGAVVMDRKAYVPFFAGLRHVQLPDDDYDTVIDYALSTGVDYLVLEEYNIQVMRPQFLPLVFDRD